VSREQLRDLLAKGWLTHDGMWFDQTARAFGLEQANRLNRAAIRAMAPFEVSRLSEALECLLPTCPMPGRWRASWRRGWPWSPRLGGRPPAVWAAGRRLHWEWDLGECFAYKGMQRFGYLTGTSAG